MREIKILKFLLFGGCISLPFLFKKQPVKDWILIFCLKAFYSGFLNSFVVAQKRVKYPVRLLPKYFKIHIVFDLLLFPIACVLYNQMTYHSNFIKTVAKVFIFSIPITLFEVWAEKKTKLINYEKNWNGFYSFFSLTVTFWIVRASIALIRKVDKTTIDKYEAKTP